MSVAESTVEPAAQAAPEKAGDFAKALDRLIEQFNDWRDLNEENEKVAQLFLDQAYLFHHGYGIEREIECLELTVSESAQCRSRAIVFMTGPRADRPFPELSVDASAGVRACALLTHKRAQLEAAREKSLIDAAARLDRLLRKGVEPPAMLQSPLPKDRPTLSWRMAQGGSVQPFVLGLERVYKNATREVMGTNMRPKWPGQPGYGKAGHWLPTVEEHKAEDPPAQAATSKVG
jgi:hypothetical protein